MFDSSQVDSRILKALGEKHKEGWMIDLSKSKEGGNKYLEEGMRKI